MSPQRLYIRLQLRLQELTDPAERDRGDGPVPTAIIIAGLGILAAAVVAWAVAAANGYMAKLP